MSDGPEWFAPKRYGIGSGLPIRWQGWVVLGIFLAAIGATIIVWGDRPEITTPLILIQALFLMLICARTTRGGWRWRWGGED
jgi:hypothetical protein